MQPYVFLRFVVVIVYPALKSERIQYMATFSYFYKFGDARHDEALILRGRRGRNRRLPAALVQSLRHRRLPFKSRDDGLFA